jgi:hypothetical protein
MRFQLNRPIHSNRFGFVCDLSLQKNLNNLSAPLGLGKLFNKSFKPEKKNLNSSKTNEPIKKWASEPNRTFSKEEIPMAKKHMKKCSPSLAIKEMQIKTTLRFHLTPFLIAIISNTTNRCWCTCGEKGTLFHCWWECKLV